MQESALQFYGTSFLTTETGAIAAQASRSEETVLLHTYDLDRIAQEKLDWGLFRDRRPECYGDITAG